MHNLIKLNFNQTDVLKVKTLLLYISTDDLLLACLSPYFQKPVSYFSSFWDKQLWSFTPIYYLNYIVQGSGITLNLNYLHYKTMYVVPIERAWLQPYGTKYSKLAKIE